VTDKLKFLTPHQGVSTAETLEKHTMMNALVRTPNGVKCMKCCTPKISEPSEVKIKVLRAAICRTDVFAAMGTIAVDDGRVLGHEFVGVVEEIGSSVSTIRPGCRVVVNPLVACGECDTCKTGMNHQCPNSRFMGIDIDGAFAQWIVAPANQVHELPLNVSDAVGAYAEPLAAVMAILDADLPANEVIAVTGTGRIADLTECVLADHGYQVARITDTNAESRTFGAVVETDLKSENTRDTLNLLKPGGLLVLKSRIPGEISLAPLHCITRRLRIQAVHYAPFERALKYLELSKDRLETFIGETWELEDFEKAFTAACADEKLKIYFAPNG